MSERVDSAGNGADRLAVAISEPLQAATTGRFHLHPGEPGAPLLVGFHGYGETAEKILAELAQVASSPELPGWSVAAVEALHPFYTRQGEVVRSWMTRVDRELAIADNVAYVGATLARLARLAPFPFWVACGFSQGAAMAWRSAVRLAVASERPARCRAVIALGGDLPPDLDDLPALPFEQVLLGRGRRDEWYTPEKLAADRERLGRLGLVPEVHEFDGGHEWTAEFQRRAGDFLQRML